MNLKIRKLLLDEIFRSWAALMPVPDSLGLRLELIQDPEVRFPLLRQLPHEFLLEIGDDPLLLFQLGLGGVQLDGQELRGSLRPAAPAVSGFLR